MSAENCFWTDLVSVSQDCADAPPPSDIAPVRDYRSFCDNGVMALEWANYDGESPYSTAESGFGLYLSGGDWNVIANVQSYFPRDPADRVTADLNIFRALRQNTTAVFGGNPYNFETWAESVGTVNLDNLSVIESINGGVPFRVVGLAPGLPAFDPDYIYFISAALNIYSPADDLVATYSQPGAVYDQAGEVPDADDVTKQIKLTVEVAPEEFAVFDTVLLGVGAAYVEGNGNSILFYAVGSWRGEASEFTCSDFMAAIDGEAAVNVPTTCS